MQHGPARVHRRCSVRRHARPWCPGQTTRVRGAIQLILLPSARVTVHQPAGVGYERTAGGDERSCLSYPMSALAEVADVLGLDQGRTVVDLGAGHGKFTRLLALTGARVIAVEPVAERRERLAELLPSVSTVEGTAERTGLPDASADAVVAAQSWHRFPQEAAFAEVERVLRPSGALALVWNGYDTSVPWVRDLQSIYRRHAVRTSVDPNDGRWLRVLGDRAGWSPVRERHLPHSHRMARQRVVERMLSSGPIATLSPPERAAVRTEFEEALGQHRETRDRESIELPYTTDVYWAHRA